MNTDTSTEEITEETKQLTKIVCHKCNKQFTIHYFRYIHNLKCEGVIEKDYTRPIRQYNKKIKEIEQPEQEDTPNTNTNNNLYKNSSSNLEYAKPNRQFKDYSRLKYDII